MLLTGRQPIYYDEEVRPDTIAKIMTYATQIHGANAIQCNYLYDYYKGKQPILGKSNETNPNINNIVIENRANEIVSFKTGYLMGEPIQYISRGATQTDKVNRLNAICNFDSKANKDKALAEWFFICGTAYRMIMPGNPVKTSVLNPSSTFVVYRNDIENEPILGVIQVKKDTTTIYYAYSKDTYYELDATFDIIKSEPHTLGMIPIIEYPANNARLGAFEIVITLLDAINRLQSDRLDAVDMFVQALLVIQGAMPDEDMSLSEIKKKGGLYLPKDADAKYLTQELNQQQTQILADTMYQSILTICGMPNRNGGTSTSDTGVAVIMRDGWSAAEARAKDQELMFKQSENECLKLMCNIINAVELLDIDVSDIDIRFTRRNYDNISEKASVLTTMLGNSKIHPKLAFEYCGMFPDSDLAYTISQDHYNSEIEKRMSELREVENERVHTNG